MPKSFVMACKEFFGLKPGQTLTQFSDEIKTLSDDDKSYFKREFAKIGVEIA